MNGALSKLSRTIGGLTSCIPKQRYPYVSQCCLRGRTVSPSNPQCRNTHYIRHSPKVLSVEEALAVSKSNSPEENVNLFSTLSESYEGYVECLTGMCESPVGLSAVLDMRNHCNTMIRRLPEPRLMKLDKVLFGVLETTVRFETTEIATVNRFSSPDILDVVRRSDRVHPIHTPEELVHRIADNRSVFILTHTLLPARPLVALHVAHSSGMFQCVSDVKEGLSRSSKDTLCRRSRQIGVQTANSEQEHPHSILHDGTGDLLSCLQFPDTSQYKQVNTFYSISSLEIALRGIPCGGWCISKAKSQLSVPNSIYTTLSPIPGFRNWCDVSLKRGSDKVLDILGGSREDVQDLLASPHDVLVPSHLRVTLSRLAGYYLLREKQRGNTLDPVAHFHVTNGAVVWGLRWGGLRSKEMMEQSLGLMVNYLYDAESPDRAAQYASDEKTVTVGAAVANLVEM